MPDNTASQTPLPSNTNGSDGSTMSDSQGGLTDSGSALSGSLPPQSSDVPGSSPVVPASLSPAPSVSDGGDVTGAPAAGGSSTTMSGDQPAAGAPAPSATDVSATFGTPDPSSTFVQSGQQEGSQPTPQASLMQEQGLGGGLPADVPSATNSEALGQAQSGIADTTSMPVPSVPSMTAEPTIQQAPTPDPAAGMGTPDVQTPPVSSDVIPLTPDVSPAVLTESSQITQSPQQGGEVTDQQAAPLSSEGMMSQDMTPPIVSAGQADMNSDFSTPQAPVPVATEVSSTSPLPADLPTMGEAVQPNQPAAQLESSPLTQPDTGNPFVASEAAGDSAAVPSPLPTGEQTTTTVQASDPGLPPMPQQVTSQDVEAQKGGMSKLAGGNKKILYVVIFILLVALIVGASVVLSLLTNG